MVFLDKGHGSCKAYAMSTFLNVSKYSGRLGDSFYQGCKGGGIQKKTLARAWHSNRRNDTGVQKYRDAFRLAVKGKKFPSKAAKCAAIKQAMSEVPK
jgi:hypothetical protein